MIFAQILANLITAFSYFWLPVQGYIFISRHSNFFPGWLTEWLRLFVLFVLFCGLHHFCMVFLLLGGEMHHPPILIFVDWLMAIVSALAAIKFRPFLRLLLSDPKGHPRYE